MAERNVSVDEFVSARKNFSHGDVVVKLASGASSWDKTKRSVDFVMSAEVEDRDRDIVVQKGLDIEQFKQNPVAFFNHNSQFLPVGKWSDIKKITNTNLKRTEGTLTLVPTGMEEIADRLANHIEFGTINACSIGFIPKAITQRDEKDWRSGFMIHESELVECSPVNIPSNPMALAKAAQLGDPMPREMIEEILDNWKNINGILVHKSQWEEAHQEATGQRTTVVVNDADRRLAIIEEEQARRLAAGNLRQDGSDATSDDEPVTRGWLRRTLDVFMTRSGTDDGFREAAEQNSAALEEALHPIVADPPPVEQMDLDLKAARLAVLTKRLRAYELNKRSEEVEQRIAQSLG